MDERLLENLVRWCQDESENLVKQITMLEAGELTIAIKKDGLGMADGTAEFLEEAKRKLADIDDIFNTRPVETEW